VCGRGGRGEHHTLLGREGGCCLVWVQGRARGDYPVCRPPFPRPRSTVTSSAEGRGPRAFTVAPAALSTSMEIRLLSPPKPGYTAPGMPGDVPRADQEPRDRGRFVIRWQGRACLRGRTVQDGRSKRPLSPNPSPAAHATTPPRSQISYQSLTALRATRRVCKSGAYSLRGSGEAAFIPPHFHSSKTAPQLHHVVAISRRHSTPRIGDSSERSDALFTPLPTCASARHLAWVVCRSAACNRG